MPSIIHYPGYLSKAKAATQRGVQVRTINDWLGKRQTSPENFSFIKIDGLLFIKDLSAGAAASPPIAHGPLVWIRNFAKKHKVNYERMYEAIIDGEISGVVLAGKVFVISTEPELLNFIAAYKPLRKKGVPFHVKYPNAGLISL